MTSPKKVPPKIKEADAGDLSWKHQCGKFSEDSWAAAEESLKIPSPYPHPAVAVTYASLMTYMSSSGSFHKSHICPCGEKWLLLFFCLQISFKFLSSTNSKLEPYWEMWFLEVFLEMWFSAALLQSRDCRGGRWWCWVETWHTLVTKQQGHWASTPLGCLKEQFFS